MINTIIDGKKVKLYDNLYDWIIDEFDLDFLNESGYDENDVSRTIGEYIIELSDAKNWQIVYDTKVGDEDNVEYNDVVYILIGGQDNTPVYIPDDGYSGDIYLVYYDNEKDGIYKAICKTETDSIDWIRDRVESHIEKLADKAKAWTPEDDAQDLANYLNKIDSLIVIYENELYDYIDERSYYVDVTDFEVAKGLEDKFESINNPAWACDNAGGVLLNDPERGTGDQWYVRDLDELINELED